MRKKIKKIFILEQFDSINIDCYFNIEHIKNNIATNDIISIFNEGKNFKKTIFINNIFFCGDKKKSPKITLSYLNSNIKKSSFVDIFTKGEYLGYRFNTKSFIEEISNNKSILYPHVFSSNDFKRINNSLHFLAEEKINKNNYIYFSKSKLNTIKKLFNKNYFNIGIGYTLQMNSFPLTLLHAIKELNKNINIFIFTDIIVGEKYLTNDQVNILKTFDFVNIIKINNNEKLNYLSMCDLLVSCCNDFTNIIGSSILIEEYKLCNKPILCSRGKEREKQLGKYYPGFYTARSCYVVPPIYWSRSYLINPSNYKELYLKYFKYNYDKREINEIKKIINKNYNEFIELINKNDLEKKEIIKERIRKEELENERLEKERIRKEQLEKQQLENKRLEKERIRKEHLEKQQLEKQRLENERIRKEQLEKERQKKEWLEKQRLEKERLKKVSLEKERLEKERIRKEQLENERLRKEQLENERIRKEQLENLEMYNNMKIEKIKNMNHIKNNIINFYNNYIINYKKILFVCGDYPGYGGAATNCYNLQTFFESKNKVTYGFYFNYSNIDNKKNGKYKNYEISNFKSIIDIDFKPDLIIIKSPVQIDYLKLIFKKIPIIYLIGGIYNNNLDINFTLLNTKQLQDKYINKNVLYQISKADISFTNSKHTSNILNYFYNIKLNVFYSSYVNYLNSTPLIDSNFENRKYEYGLIVSDFELRTIKNVEKSIEFLKNKENVILIGKNSSKYKNLGFDCIELVEYKEMPEYYKQIKYIVQDSHYESCSNVIVESLFNGCRYFIKKKILFVCGDYTNIGGAATNTYNLLRLFKDKFNCYCLFISNYKKNEKTLDPDNLKNVHHICLDDFVDRHVTEFNRKYGPFDIVFIKNYKIWQIINNNIKNCKKKIYSPSGIRYVGTKIRNNYIKDINLGLYFWKELIDNKIKHSNNSCNFIHLNDKFLEKIIFKENNFILCNSSITYNIIKSYYKILNLNDKNLDKILLTNISLKHDYNDNFIDREYDICFIASNWRRECKNVNLLFELIFSKRLIDKKIVIIGTINEKTKFPKNVTTFGVLTNKNVKSLLQKIKTVVIISKYDSNPNVLIEGVSMGCNIVTSPNVGNYENIDKNLLVTEYNDIDVWISKIILSLEKRYNYYGPDVNDIYNYLFKLFIKN